jgi:hypothetical protein
MKTGKSKHMRLRAIVNHLRRAGVKVDTCEGYPVIARKVWAYSHNGATVATGGKRWANGVLNAFFDTLDITTLDFRLPSKVERINDRQKREIERKGFYESKPWRAVRYIALRCSRGVCELCGAAPTVGKPLHVDHIKPRSLYPQLELEPSNLQVLCSDCNLGKSNTDEIDWRRDIPA